MSNKFHPSTKQQINISSTLKMTTRITPDTLNIFTTYCLYFRPEQPWVQRIPGLFPRDKFPSSLEFKESVEIYLHSASGPSWPVTG